MVKVIIKFAMYALIVFAFTTTGLVAPMETGTLLTLAAVLTGVNTLIRPIFTLIALPLNFFTLGIASVFANLLSFVIANAIVGRPVNGFWVMLLLAAVVMLADDFVRYVRLLSDKDQAHQVANA